MGGQIGVHQHIESLRTDHCPESGKVFRESALQAKPVLAVVNFKAFEGGEPAIRSDELFGNLSHGAAIPTTREVMRLHLFVSRKRLHDCGAHGSLQGL